jgi:trimeric autotransporter adhesin
MIKSKKLSGVIAASIILAGGTVLGMQTVGANSSMEDTINVTKNVNAGGAVNAGSVNSRGNITAKDTISGKTITASGTIKGKDLIGSNSITSQGTISATGNISTQATVGAKEMVAQTNVTANNKVVGMQGVVDNTLADGNYVKAGDTVGQNVDALDRQFKTDKTSTALHVDKEGNLTVGTNHKVMKAVNVSSGLKDGTTEAGQANLVSADNTVGKNLTALDNAIGADEQKINANTTNISNLTKNVVDITNTQNAAIQQNSKAIVSVKDMAQKGIDKANAEIHTNAGNIAQNKADIKTNADNISNLTKNVVDITNTQNAAIQQNSKAIVSVKDMAQKGIDKANAEIHTNAGNIAQNKADIAANKGAIADEAAAREAGDTKEANERTAADNALQTGLNKEIATREDAVTRLQDRIHDVSKEVDTVGALSMAMSGLHPLSYDEGDARFQLSAAVGTYDGTEALALGGFYHFNHDALLSVGVATDLGADEHRMGANIGYTRRIGQGGRVVNPSAGTVSDIMKDIQALKDKQAALEEENDNLKKQLAALQK